jgi:hypothetical protein
LRDRRSGSAGDFDTPLCRASADKSHVSAICQSAKNDAIRGSRSNWLLLGLDLQDGGESDERGDDCVSGHDGYSMDTLRALLRMKGEIHAKHKPFFIYVEQVNAVRTA